MNYLVTMARWGSLEDHNYIIGCFSNKTRAIKIGEKEYNFRGGKYSPYVTEVDTVPDGIVLNEVDSELLAAIKRGLV